MRQEIQLLHSWKTHYNGTRPYQVSLVTVHDKPCVCITKQSESEAHFLHIIKNIDRLFVGKSIVNGITKTSLAAGHEYDGNSILVVQNESLKKYWFVGDMLIEFTSPEIIEEFYSPVGNNDVPYPVAVSKSFVFYFAACHEGTIEYCLKSDLPTGIDYTDSYKVYYGEFDPVCGEWVSSLPVEKIHRIRIIDKGV